RLLRRREAEKELRGVGNEIGTGNPGGDRHLLRQRRLAGEAAAREAAADARDVQEVERTQLTLRVVDVRPDVTAQQEGNVVALEDRVGGRAAGDARTEET